MPKLKPNGVVGLSLSRKSGCLVALEGDGVGAVRSFPLECGEAGVTDIPGFAVALAKELEPLSPSRLALVVEPLVYAVRTLELPSMPPSELRSVVEGEAQQYIIFEDQPLMVAFSQEATRAGEGGNLERVLVAATAKPALAPILASVREQGQVSYVAPPVAALLSSYFRVASEGVEALVVLGGEQSYFFGVENKHLIFTRSLDYGEKEMEEEIHQEFLLECQNTLTFFEARENCHAQRIVVLAQPASGEALAEQLAAQVDRKVQWVDLTEGVSFSGEEVREAFRKLSPQSLAAYAAALALKEGNYFLNLVPFEEEAREQLKTFGKRALIPTLSILLFFFLAGLFLRSRVGASKKEVQTLQRKLSEAKNVVENQQKLQEEVGRLDRELALLRSSRVQVATTYPHSGISTLFQGVKQIVPQSVWMSKVEYEKGVLTFEGHGTSQVGAAKFVEYLSQADLCQVIGLASLQRKVVAAKNVYDFTVHCQLKGGALS